MLLLEYYYTFIIVSNRLSNCNNSITRALALEVSWQMMIVHLKNAFKNAITV